MDKKVEEITEEYRASLKEFGSWLKELREKKGLSQAQLGREVGVSRQAVSMWEAGTNHPNNRRVNALLEILGAKKTAREVAKLFMRPGLTDRPTAGTDIPVSRPKLIEGYEDRFAEPEVTAWYTAPDSIPAHMDMGCIFMPGTSMVPWRFQGEPVFFDNDRPPKIGDHCLARLAPPGTVAKKGRQIPSDAQFAVRLLTGLSSDSVRLKAYLSSTEEVIPLSEVGRLARVLEWSEMFGPLATVWDDVNF